MPYSPEYVSLSSCDLSNLSPKPEKFILAFQGKMGNETGAVVGNADITSLKTTTQGQSLPYQARIRLIKTPHSNIQRQGALDVLTM